MAQRGSVGAGGAASVVVLILALPVNGHHLEHRPPAASATTLTAALIRASGDSVPVTPVPTPVTYGKKKSRAGPPLWVGAVVGIGGLAGLSFSWLGRDRRRGR